MSVDQLELCALISDLIFTEMPTVPQEVIAPLLDKVTLAPATTLTVAKSAIDALYAPIKRVAQPLPEVEGLDEEIKI